MILQLGPVLSALKRFSFNDLHTKARSGLSLTLHLLVLSPPLRRPLSFLFELFRDPQVTGTRIVYSVLE
jgi:hypothetical protein